MAMYKLNRLVGDLQNIHLDMMNSIEFRLKLHLCNFSKPFMIDNFHRDIDKTSMKCLQDKSLLGNFEHMNNSMYKGSIRYYK